MGSTGSVVGGSTGSVVGGSTGSVGGSTGSVVGGAVVGGSIGAVVVGGATGITDGTTGATGSEVVVVLVLDEDRGADGAVVRLFEGETPAVVRDCAGDGVPGVVTTTEVAGARAAISGKATTGTVGRGMTGV